MPAKKPRVRERTAAVVTVFRAPDMTLSGRRAIARWLRQQAIYIERYANNLAAERFTARYLY